MTSATQHGTITDEGLAAMRSRIGIPSETRRYGATRGLFTLINQDSAHHLRDRQRRCEPALH